MDSLGPYRAVIERGLEPVEQLQAIAGFVCGSGSPPARKRRRSASVREPRSLVEYRWRSSTGRVGGVSSSFRIRALGPVLFGLVDPHRLKRPVWQMRAKPPPKRHREVLGGGNPVGEPGNVCVQIA